MRQGFIGKPQIARVSRYALLVWVNTWRFTNPSGSSLLYCVVRRKAPPVSTTRFAELSLIQCFGATAVARGRAL